MSTLHPLILVDRFAAVRAGVLGGRRRLFRDFSIFTAADGLPWAVKAVGDQQLAIPLVEAGWYFDPYARTARSQRVEQRLAQLTQLNQEDRLRELHDLVARLRFGPQCELCAMFGHCADDAEFAARHNNIPQFM